MPIGVLTNCAAVLVGGLLGTALGKILPPALKEHLPGLFGYCAIAIGVNSIIKASGMTAVVLAILVGFVVGLALSTIPVVGWLLSGIIVPLTTATGGLLGLVADTKKLISNAGFEVDLRQKFAGFTKSFAMA